jgi:hypothetical protein
MPLHPENWRVNGDIGLRFCGISKRKWWRATAFERELKCGCCAKRRPCVIRKLFFYGKSIEAAVVPGGGSRNNIVRMRRKPHQPARMP